MPLDAAARAVVGRAKEVAGIVPARPPLTDQDKRDAREAIKGGQICVLCGGLHVCPSTLACPRVASGKLNGDGAVIEVTFWAMGQWDTSRVLFAADVEDDLDESEHEPEAG